MLLSWVDSQNIVTKIFRIIHTNNAMEKHIVENGLGKTGKEIQF